MHATRLALLPIALVLALGVAFAASSKAQSGGNVSAAQAAAQTPQSEYVPADRNEPSEFEVTDESGDSPESVRVIHGRSGGGVTVVDDPEDGQPQIIYETRRTETRRRRVTSIGDLVGLSRQDLERMNDDDVDLEGIRDDVNGNLGELADGIRTLNQSFRISGVSNAAGTAATGGSGWDNDEYHGPLVFVPAPGRTPPPTGGVIEVH